MLSAAGLQFAYRNACGLTVWAQCNGRTNYVKWPVKMVSIVITIICHFKNEERYKFHRYCQKGKRSKWWLLESVSSKSMWFHAYIVQYRLKIRTLNQSKMQSNPKTRTRTIIKKHMQTIISCESQQRNKKCPAHYNQSKELFKGLMTEQKFSESVQKGLCHEVQHSAR